jgi:hypothetical protein
MAERDITPEAAHDVLAAEAFAMPAPDPDLHRRGPIQLPEDPTGLAEPHDILAAEEFPMPASHAPPTGTAALAERRGGLPRLAIEVAAGFVVLALLRRLLRR